MRNSWKLPNGKETDSQKEYYKAWDNIIIPLQEKLGVRVNGFNPDLSIVDNETDLSAAIPLWLALKIIGEPTIEDSTNKRLTPLQKELLQKIDEASKEFSGHPWVEIHPKEVRTARSLAKRNILELNGDFEARRPNTQQ